MADFKDWIPADEDPGAMGKGFTDFVPAKEPAREKPIEQPKAEIQPEPKKKK